MDVHVQNTNTPVRPYLHQQGLRARGPVVKQKLPAPHKSPRLQWAVTHRQWRLAAFRNGLISDDVRLYLKLIDGHWWVWCRPGEHLEQCIVQKTDYGGGSIMVWSGNQLDRKHCTRMHNWEYECSIVYPWSNQLRVLHYVQQAGPRTVYLSTR